jgi:hypothetical protein
MGKYFMRLSQADGVVQSIGPEFKPSITKKTKQQKKSVKKFPFAEKHWLFLELTN